MTTNLNLPEAYAKDIARAVEILKAGGCHEIYLFGSLAEGKVRDGSDIDFAVKGCPSGKYYELQGKLLRALQHSADLVNLDWEDPFTNYLSQEGRLLPIG